MRRVGFILAIGLVLWLASSGLAAEPIVRAILFYSPTCPHCHEVMTKDLPPLKAQYGSQLQIAEVNILEPEGRALYQVSIVRFNIPPERQGVPTLIVGDQILVGSLEIPERFPSLIAEGLKAGGIDWPDIPNFKPPPDQEASAIAAPRLSLRQRLAQDPAGNALAIVVLVGMIAVTGWVGFQIRRVQRSSPLAVAEHGWRAWATPALSVAGLAIAAYLSYVELLQTPAFCGPVGNCNVVQQSPYAWLWGVLPVGVLGVVGYVAILAAWAIGRWGQVRTAAWGNLALLAFTGLGTLFSIYLTYLEPFVIGAACIWCLTSAVIMTALLALNWQPGVAAWFVLRPAPAHRARQRRMQARRASRRT
ncbi:MAG: vitamin K epoxide reductase family protein [Anaerolineae bacterium]|nr:vitamin K epoxide reductase [Anaerolineae bacterium]MDW8098824.1 vitamin K epoxide reductase family protein [Anaerolineae bacterium]